MIQVFSPRFNFVVGELTVLLWKLQTCNRSLIVLLKMTTEKEIELKSIASERGVEPLVSHRIDFAVLRKKLYAIYKEYGFFEFCDILMTPMNLIILIYNAVSLHCYSDYFCRSNDFYSVVEDHDCTFLKRFPFEAFSW